VLLEYADTGAVRRFPTAFLCMSLTVISVLCVATGLILDLVAHVRREAKRLIYLQHPAPQRLKRPTDRTVRDATSSRSQDLTAS